MLKVHNYDFPIIIDKNKVFHTIHKIQKNCNKPHYRECIICKQIIDQNTNTHWIYAPNTNISVAEIEKSTFIFNSNGTILKDNIII